MGDPFSDYLRENPVLILVAMYIFYKFVKLNFEVPEIKGSRVLKIVDMDQWIDALRIADQEDKLIVLLFHKNRSFACRKVMPKFGEMSKLYHPNEVLFAKCNADFNWEIRTSYKVDEEVISLPYVKLFKGAESVGFMHEWNEKELEELISEAGGPLPSPEAPPRPDIAKFKDE